MTKDQINAAARTHGQALAAAIFGAPTMHGGHPERVSDRRLDSIVRILGTAIGSAMRPATDERPKWLTFTKHHTNTSVRVRVQVAGITTYWAAKMGGTILSGPDLSMTVTETPEQIDAMLEGR